MTSHPGSQPLSTTSCRSTFGRLVVIDSPRVLVWPRVVPRWHFGADWCVPGRVFQTLPLVEPIVDPVRLRDSGGPAPGVVLVFDTPTTTFLRQVAPVLIDRSIPFAVCVVTALVRTRAPRRATSGTAVTWSELRALVDLGVTVAVRGHDTDELRYLPDELAFGQLANAKHTVRRFLDVDPWLVCDPATSSRASIAAIARELGFESGVVRRNGRAVADDRMRRAAVVPRPWQSAGSIARSLRAKARAAAS